MTTRKASANKKEKGNGDRSIASPVGIVGWVKPTSQNRDVGHPHPRWAEVEVEKRISPLRGSQMREPLRSK
jgi:hypothetical protein